MKSLSPYLFFNGNCKKAMEFYQKALGGDLKIFTAGQADQEMFKGSDPDSVLNAALTSPKVSFMASDNMKKDQKFGDSICMFLDCVNKAEVDKIYAALVKGGEADMKPQDQFWGAYMGSLTDAFGINWMVNCQDE